MKNLHFTTFLLAILLLILASSCSVQKRVHRPGYHMKFNKSLSVADANEKKTENTKVSFEKSTPKYKQSEVTHNRFVGSNEISDDAQTSIIKELNRMQLLLLLKKLFLYLILTLLNARLVLQKNATTLS